MSNKLEATFSSFAWFTISTSVSFVDQNPWAKKQTRNKQTHRIQTIIRCIFFSHQDFIIKPNIKQFTNWFIFVGFQFDGFFVSPHLWMWMHLNFIQSLFNISTDLIQYSSLSTKSLKSKLYNQRMKPKTWLNCIWPVFSCNYIDEHSNNNLNKHLLEMLKNTSKSKSIPIHTIKSTAFHEMISINWEFFRKTLSQTHTHRNHLQPWTTTIKPDYSTIFKHCDMSDANKFHMVAILQVILHREGERERELERN